MAAVTDPAAVVRDGLERLHGAGWVLVPPELDRRSWRRFLLAPDAEGRRRVAHLHLLRPDEPRWTQHLAFRDLLRADADLRRRYAELKAELAVRYPRDRERYSEAKADFIQAALHPRHSGEP
ncbi:MAG: GrpB family protein [Actinomycetota bacterium]|nr:GrpB family protein [Actinomycetota bacterium]